MRGAYPNTEDWQSHSGDQLQIQPLRISIKCPRYFHKIYVIWDHWIELEMNVPTFSRYKYVYIYIYIYIPLVPSG